MQNKNHVIVLNCYQVSEVSKICRQIHINGEMNFILILNTTFIVLKVKDYSLLIDYELS